MTEQTSPVFNRIHAYITNRNWLHIEDALHFEDSDGKPIPKIRMFAGSYQRGQGSKLYMAHYIDLQEVRPVLEDLKWGKRIDYTEYKGGHVEGQLQSRVLRINMSGDKIWFNLKQGPGELTANGTGAVKPKSGAPTDEVNISMTIEQARAMACNVLEYIFAWRVQQKLMNYHPPAELPESTRDMGPELQSVDEINADLFGADPAGASQAEPEEYEPEKPPPHYSYSNGTPVPNDPKTRAFFDAYMRKELNSDDPNTRPDREHLQDWYNNLSDNEKHAILHPESHPPTTPVLNGVNGHGAVA